MDDFAASEENTNRYFCWSGMNFAICEGVKKQFVQSRLKDHIQFLEDHLSQHEYFAGRFSFADIQMSFPLEAMQSRTGKSYPAIQAYLERISHRAAYFRALSKEQALKS